MSSTPEPKRILQADGSALAPESAQPYRKPLKEFRWHDVQYLFSQSFESWSRHKAPRLGASLAFYTLLSLAPLLLVAVAVVGLVFGRQAAQRDIIQQIQLLVGSQGAKAAEALLGGSRNTTHGIVATVVGLITLLFGASGVMIELRDALNTIWEVPEHELKGLHKLTGFIKDRLFSFGMVLSIGFLLIISLAVSAWIAALGAVSASVLPGNELLLHFVNSLVSFLVITVLFSAIYKVLPEVKIEWGDVFLGGALTSLLFTIGKLALGIYLGKASIASSYGAFASIVVLVVWVYYSGQIFFLGAEVTRIFALQHGSQPRPSSAQPLVITPGAPLSPAAAPRIITPDQH